MLFSISGKAYNFLSEPPLLRFEKASFAACLRSVKLCNWSDKVMVHIDDRNGGRREIEGVVEGNRSLIALIMIQISCNKQAHSLLTN